jgi:hypothetical protein
MSALLYLIPIALLLGVVGLAAFLWALRYPVRRRPAVWTVVLMSVNAAIAPKSSD